MTRPITLTTGQIADLVGGQVIGSSNRELNGVAPLKTAQSSDLSFFTSREYLTQFEQSLAGAVLLSLQFQDLDAGPENRIVVEDPQRALIAVLATMYPPAENRWGLATSASVGRNVSWKGRIAVGQNTVIGMGVRFGANCVLGDNVVVGAGTRFGDWCRIDDNVSVHEDCLLGDRVRIKSGARIGTAGFGFADDGAQRERIPHTGRCVIKDDVEIGANTTVDRGTVGDTVVGTGTKIDNLVQIAHNVTVGSGCIILAQVGIAGSTEIGDAVILAGQAGLSGHLTVGDRARVAAQSGVIGDIPPGATVSGYPARNHREVLRQTATLTRLVPIVDEIESLARSVIDA